MNKSELIKEIANETGLTQADAGRALDATCDIVTNAVKKNDQVTITGFGTFARKDKPARVGRNPRTGEPVQIKAKKSAVWKPAAALKDL